MALMARAYNQAQKFGVEMAIPDEALSLPPSAPGEPFTLNLGGDQQARARSLMIATGPRYRRLDIAGLSDFESGCVHYWASPWRAACARARRLCWWGAAIRPARRWSIWPVR